MARWFVSFYENILLQLKNVVIALIASRDHRNFIGMGAIFSKTPDEAPDLRVDLETARPEPHEAEVFDYLLQQLRPAGPILHALRSYQGCSDAIRQAISSPSPQTEEAA